MQDLNDKITGGTLEATEWNEVPSEIQNVIESQGIALSGGDLNQFGKALSGYISNGNFYSDSGIANSYALNVVGSRQNPPSLVDGFQVSFLTANPNTLASTANVAGLGVKSIKLRGGDDPVENDISGCVELSYDLSNDWFELKNPKVTNQTITKATIAEATGDDILVIGSYVRIADGDRLFEVKAAGTEIANPTDVFDSDTPGLFQLVSVSFPLLPFLLIISGQSNAEGANSGGPNPASDRVKTWDAVTGDWGGSDITAVPWTRSSPDGNGGGNNFALAAAHYIADETGREVFIVFDAVSGTSITEWVGAGVGSTRYASLKTKIELALATPEMTTAGITGIDALIWAQGEEDFGSTFATHLSNMTTLDDQFKAETWVSEFTPFYIMGMSPLHDRYQVSAALRNFSNKENGQWRYLSTRSLRTTFQETGSGDFTHWLGDDLWSGGFDIIGPAVVNNERFSNEDNDGLFWNRGGGNANVSDATAISSFNSLVNWGSRTSGLLSESFDGDGATVDFPLDYRGTSIMKVEVGGIEIFDPADYSTATATDETITVTFVVAPAVGTDNVVVSYADAINAPAATDSISFGYACHADGNQTFAGGYRCATNNLSNYTILWGNDLYADGSSDFSAGHGFQNVISNTYSFVAGRGNTVADSGGTAIGLFTEFVAVEADNVMLQVGIGTTTANRANGLAVRKSGIVEMPSLPIYADDAAAGVGGLVQGQLYITAGGAIRGKV